MLTAIHPKLPMRDKQRTRDFYLNKLGFEEFGIADFPGYLMVAKDQIQIHFFQFDGLDPLQNYGQVYIRTNAISAFYDRAFSEGITHPTAGQLEDKPWGQKEFSILDPDHNLLTFGQDLW